MSDSSRQPASQRRGHRRRSLHRTVLSLAIGAILAAWLPFSVMYVSALMTRASLAAKPGLVQSSGAATGQPVHALAPVTTRTSGTSPP